MKIVLGTNVLVSALITPEGNPAKVLNLILNNKLSLVYDSRIINEYETVLNRPKFNLDANDVEVLMETLKENGEYILPPPYIGKLTDEEDRAFLEVSLSDEVRFLITGNSKHFPKLKKLNVISPTDFLKTTPWES